MVETRLKDRKVGDERIVLIGGHPRWQKFFKKDNPTVKVISPNKKIINRGILDHIDRVFINTHHLSHNQYESYMNLIKTRKIPVEYVR